MIKKKNKFILIFLLFSLAISYEVYWHPENPDNGDEVTIYIEVLDDLKYNNSYPMYIHFKSNDIYSSYAMFLDYTKGPSVWSYSFDIKNSISFFINDILSPEIGDDGFITISSDISEDNVNIFSDDFYEALLLLSDKNYSKGFLLLENIISNHKDEEIAAEAEYIYAEIYLNDFEEYKIAANYYTKIINNYPKSYNVVKKSMFTLAYIYANHLDYYTDAIDTYETFKEEYPYDELIISVDYELESLYKHDIVIKSLLNSTK